MARKVHELSTTLTGKGAPDAYVQTWLRDTSDTQCPIIHTLYGVYNKIYIETAQRAVH